MQNEKNNKATITVNGAAYGSIDAMPPDVRRQYEDAMRMLTTDRDGNGTLDAFEGKHDPADVPMRNGLVSSSVSRHVVGNGSDIETTGDITHAVREDWMDAIRDESQSAKPANSEAPHATPRATPAKPPREMNIGKWLPLAIIFTSALVVLYYATAFALR